MMRAKLFLGLIPVLGVQLLLAQIPQTISYQGVLTDAAGDPVVDGDYSLQFRLFDGPDPGTATGPWTEQRMASDLRAVPVSGGIFQVNLGEVIPFSTVPLAFDQPYWLEIAVFDGAWTYLTPLVPLVASPYALNAGSVTGTGNVFPSTGNVGIGTTAPTSALVVAGTVTTTNVTATGNVSAVDVNASGTVYTADLNATGNADVAGTMTAASFWGNGANLTGLTASPWTANGDSIYYNTGNVGIGTTSPQAMLHIQSPNVEGILIGSNDTTGVYLVNWPTFGGQLNLFDASQVTQAKIRGYAINGVQAYFTAGNVGIGTMDPADALEVVGTVSATNVVAANNVSAASMNVSGTVTANSFVGDGSALIGLTPSPWGTSGSNIYYNSGNVGIGTSTPTAKLDVAGDIKANSLILPVTTRYYAIPAREFSGGQGNMAFDSLSHWIYSIWKANISAAVHLPHGAVITEFQAKVEDSNNDSTAINFAIDLWEVAAGSAPTSIKSLATLGALGFQTLASTTSYPVDNQNYTYLVTAVWQAPVIDFKALKLYDIRITYTVTSPLP